jgi:hypothetical protein
VALDLLFGPRKRWWARDPDPLTAAPAPGAAPEKPGERALREARALDSKVKVRPTGGGAVLSTRVKWG